MKLPFNNIILYESSWCKFIVQHRHPNREQQSALGRTAAFPRDQAEPGLKRNRILTFIATFFVNTKWNKLQFCGQQETYKKQEQRREGRGLEAYQLSAGTSCWVTMTPSPHSGAKVRLLLSCETDNIHHETPQKTEEKERLGIWGGGVCFYM
jgi:hypothetical protein